MCCLSSTTVACNNTSSTSCRMTNVPVSLGDCGGGACGGAGGGWDDGGWVYGGWFYGVWVDWDWKPSGRGSKALHAARPAKGCASIVTAAPAQSTYFGRKEKLAAHLFLGPVISGP